METVNRQEILFYITKETIQDIALEKLNRRLTEEELEIAKKGVEGGLLFDIDTVYNTIFFEMIQKN
ncbi:MAG: hypothetical protein DRN71_04540 [Candidatus Nanohalarchaeota archaeon]|nr:MAG: hypothetical protein DRN71_04540 [Candidatus Nanohaloarchaeota archaeon]